MFNDRRTRYDDKLFIAMIVIPVLVAGVRFLESKSEMDQIAMQNKPQVTAVAKSNEPTKIAANLSIVHRF
jgi:hypothetical protein